MFRNMASSLFLTEGDWEDEDNAPKVSGRIVTTIEKAKEVRGLVERCITIAKRSIPHQQKADGLKTDAAVGSPEWNEWNQAIAPVITARRRAAQLLGNKQAVRILFDDVAPRFADRDGGYTRVLRLAQVRLGDGGTQAILEFVGTRDRVSERSQAPSFEDSASEASASEESADEATEDATAVAEPEASETAEAPEADTAATEEQEKRSDG